MPAMTTIDVGAAELRALVKVLSASSSGGHVATTAKERAALTGAPGFAFGAAMLLAWLAGKL